MAEEVGVGFAGNLIFGDIAETPDTIAESLAFWFEYGRKSDVFMAEVKPYPGSKLFEVCRERGMFGDKKDYYEHISDFSVNMTSIPDDMYGVLITSATCFISIFLFILFRTVGEALSSP